LAENRQPQSATLGEDGAVLEARLQSDQIVSFDGRVLEVFEPGGASRRYHADQLGPFELSPVPDGGFRLDVESTTISFTPQEAPLARRLLAALARVAVR
jgi:hypothetical protein